MGILPDLAQADLRFQKLIFVDKNNKPKGRLNVFGIRALTDNQFFNLLRSDLERVLYNHLDKDIEFIFGDTIRQMEQDAAGVTIIFRSGKMRSFDLVVGADGLHSNVRTLIFGNELEFEKYYGYYTASFTINNYLKSDKVFVSYTIPGKQTNIYLLNENKLATLFIFSSPQKLNYDHHDMDAQKQILRNEFGNAGWECASLLEIMDTAPDFYFDSVSQTKMNHWSKGRVSLVGDACDCPSLLSGQGSTLAMVGAYILAGELKESDGNYEVAFQRYEDIFKPLIDNKQKLAQRFAGSLVPKNKFALWLRNTFANLMFSSFVSKWFVKKYMTDEINLKEY
jgi:2-polyprenyl-6-methoxyphenol hydroxylase-like FAD-dependent oxidoreductase